MYIFTLTEERRDSPQGKVKKSQHDIVSVCESDSLQGRSKPKGAPHTPKYLDHFLRVWLATFTTGPIVVTATTYKYLDKFLMVLLVTFTTWFVFVKLS